MKPTDLDRRRVVIEHVRPNIDCGRFPAKRTAGEPIVVEADVFADGHHVLSAVLRYRRVSPAPAGDWREAPMHHVDNDRWQGTFTPDRIGDYEYTVEAWIDEFGSWRADLEKWAAAGGASDAELAEGAVLVKAAAERAAKAKRADAARALTAFAAALTTGDLATRVRLALGDDLTVSMARYPDRRRSTTLDAPLPLLVDRERARFGSWYEMFPRSNSPEPGRSATFREAERQLQRIADLGFDVLYLPPIHPIGIAARKGPNNNPVCGPGDPGSPWAIGSAEGGHKDVEPGLGTLDDFDHFVAAARKTGLEIALDLAYQCSPDHPYVKTHPEWFRHRPDGSIKYAENPPKKYQDIYPIDFETEDAAGLWEELRSIILFWMDHGVRIFRVDNPHTKAFRFWEWALRSIHRDNPDVIFLAEAFTRPKVMRHLAKLGFTQSYTYFTWRNAKRDIEEYFIELTTTEMREYFRPNLFANTPDILHAYLQEGGRPAFQVRLILAATLGATYGIYSGFEICENQAVAPGSEEYLDSEKYQFRQRQWERPGHINDLIRTVNAM
ncbi:MAG TPA: alpha-1,4-glucan--maltose-1-phosphate maltosyltransferase, partial [Vicinamibacterales bacterium]|nr:alpha-1,4-glucan--maltose-1-phosphate maltosyltransferase [Vicinamibacterales bacterium]